MTHVVIDNGAGFVKFGLLGHGVPALEVPNFRAEPRIPAGNVTGGKRQAAIGERKIDELRFGYVTTRPIQAGILLDAATQMEIWQHGISTILPRHTSLADVHLTFTESPSIPPAVHSTLLELLFESHGVASVASVPTPLCNSLSVPPNSILARSKLGAAPSVITASPFPDNSSFQHLKYDYEVRVLSNNTSLPPIKPDNEGRVAVDVGFTGTVCAPTYRGWLIDSGCYRNYSGMHSVNLALQKVVEFKALNLGTYYHLVDRLRRQTCYIVPQGEVRDRVRDLSRKTNELQRDLRSYGDIFAQYSAGPEASSMNHLPYVYDARTEGIFQAPDLSLIANDQQLREHWAGKVILGPERVSSYEGIFTSPSGSNTFVARTGNDRGLCIPTRLWSAGYPKIGVNETSVRVRDSAGVVGLTTQSIFSSPPILQKSIANVICLAGSGADVPGFTQRYAEEIRSSIPVDWPLVVANVTPARLATWIGACVWSASPRYPPSTLTRERYRELGGFRNKRVKLAS